MELRSWAERLLHGDTLADKLVPLADPTDTAPGAPVDVPAAPGRPASLALRRAGPKAPFPRRVERPEDRGQLLHFFANHELLAIELGALALLRFPDAPAPFRRGLGRIVGEEQRHLRMYLDRMGEVALGDLPLSPYFWDALAGVGTPLEFVSGMSLVFEQANLDFATHYASVFREAADEATARVLDAVLEDEIGHVRHGVAWFERWRDPGLPRWDAWVGSLTPPLSPARARGPAFCRDARLRAGLDPDMVDRLAVAGGSKGRPPVVHRFFPEVEAASIGRPPSRAGRAIAEDLGTLPMFLARAEDVVVASRAPSPAFLATLAEAGFEIPEIVDSEARLAGRRVTRVAQWGDPAWRALHDRTWCADPASVCRTLDEVRARLTESSVLKAPFSTAGRGLRRPGPGLHAWIEQVIAEQGAVVVEPWLDRVADLSLQFTVRPDGVGIDGWGRFLTDGRGRYRGAVLGRRTDGLAPEIQRFLAEHDCVAKLAGTARALGARMAAAGFTGPAGIDALVYRDGEPRLRPLVELNARVTMGRVALAIERRIARGRTGLWVHPTLRELKRAGLDAPGFAAELRRRCPLALRGGLIDGGAIFTTEPTTARVLTTVLVVGRSLAECEERLGVPG